MSSSPALGDLDAVGKPKRTRKRLRLSCVECTRRRQKCDRNQPCALCVSRGVSHLCRWESVPVARPVPKKPPGLAHVPPEPSSNELLERIASLEKTLASLQQSSSSEEENGRRTTSPDTLSPHSSFSDVGSSLPPRVETPDSFSSVAFQKPPSEAYLISAALAQVSLLGHHGEYVGRGSAFCSLHMLSSPSGTPFHYAKSTDAVSLYRHPTDELMPPPLPNTLEYLIPNIPPRAVVDIFCRAFFAQANWRYGIPEEWFYTAYGQMWMVLDLPPGSGMQVNPHWLSLLFAICAISPKSVKEMAHLDDSQNLRGEVFFTSAMTARRIAEDTYLSSPVFAPMESAADGTVLGCLAAPILAYFLAERNRISEAWKLIGNSIRSAQAVGMHRDPGWKQWHTMSENERVLRTRAWWALYQWDLLYSFTLSRPSMLQSDAFDVPLPCVNPCMAIDAQLFHSLQSEFVKLSRILQKALDNCFSITFPTGESVFAIEEELRQWRSQWPPYLHGSPFFSGESNGSITARDHTSIRRQRFSLQTWYLACRMKLHRSFVTQKGQPREPDAISRTTWLRRSRALSLEIALEMVVHQCESYARMTLAREGRISEDQVPAKGTWCFEGVFSLYDAAVTIIVAMTLLEPEARLKDAEKAFDNAVELMRKVVPVLMGRRAEIASLALQSLQVLGREENWRCKDVSTMP